jgi:pimeloyl-ACP methyl ester carboxylesterase
MYRTYSKTIFENTKLHYSIYGHGEKVLLMFHGFGHTHKDMRPIEKALVSQYKIYNFDLFFHGFSEWNNGDQPLTPEYWQKILSVFLEENQIENFSLLGFSLGAKIALATLEMFPNRTESLYLIAPDGIKTNFWYQIATAPIMRNLFRQTIMRPHLFFKCIKLLGTFKLLDRSTIRFCSIQMNSREKRRRLYYTWTTLKKMSPNLPSILEYVNQNKTPITLFAGSYDRVIPLKHIANFAKKISHAHLEIMKVGHNNLLEHVASYLDIEADKK